MEAAFPAIDNEGNHSDKAEIKGWPHGRRGVLSRDDLIELQGKVVKLLGGGAMEIECDNGAVVRGVLCGKMKKYRIRV